MYNKVVNKTIKYLVISILIITVFIISLFIIPPVYAISTDDFEVIYKSSTSSSSTYQEGYTFFRYPTASRYSSICLLQDLTDLPVYMFAINNTQANTRRIIISVPIDKLNSYPSGDFIYIGQPNGGTYLRTSNFNLSNDNYKYYSYTLSYSAEIPVELYCPSYDTVDEGFVALDEFINGPSGPSLYEGINIPVGYIARIRVQNGSSFTMLTTMGTDNIAFTDNWVYNSQWYKFNDSSDPTTVMQTSGITIPWTRYGNTNILGQTNKAQYTITSTVGSYVWIYNPAYMVGQNADLYDTKLNSNIQLINVQNIDQVRIFALKSTYGYNGIVSSTSTGSGISYDPENGEWLDDNGNSVTPTEYGDTNVPATGTSIIQQLDNLLNNLITRIERLLVAPIDYINMLINSANNFFLWLRGLWSWLPSPVVESISAVLIIMCTVGALKLLWR